MNAKPNIPLINRGYVKFEDLNGMDKMNHLDIEYIKNDPWGELLKESKETGETIYEIIA